MGFLDFLRRGRAEAPSAGAERRSPGQLTRPLGLPRAPGPTEIRAEPPAETTLVGEVVVGVLVALDGDLQGQVHRVLDGASRLGRAAECEVRLRSARISRVHALLEHRQGVFSLSPRSGTSPTFLNEEPLAGVAPLSDGDTLRLGDTRLRFRSIG